MTLEEAIQHARENALSKAACGVAYRKGGQTILADCCDACAVEHEQLAKWLVELKQRREAEIAAPPKSNADRIRQMTDEELAEFLDEQSGCRLCDGYQRGICNSECIEGHLAWLRKEASWDERTEGIH